MKESALQRAVQRLVKERGGYALKIHGSEFQPASVDLLICYRGLFLGLETKVPGKKPTPLQTHILDLINKAGGVAFWADNIFDVKKQLDEIDSWFDDSET